MATRTDTENGNKGDGGGFAEFLRDAPSLDEASSGETTEVTGLISRTAEGRFAVTTADGTTYDLEVGAVRRFQAVEGQGLAKMARLEIASEMLKAAAIRQIKPFIKDLRTDPIKDMILDTKHLFTDPVHKDISTDPIGDKHSHTDPLIDPLNTYFSDSPGGGTLQEGGGLTIAEAGGGLTLAEGAGGIPDPTGQLGQPAFGQAMQAGMTPFVMATPHQAPAHLLSMQAGVQPQAMQQNPAQLKPFAHDTIKELAYAETAKEAIFDHTHKEMVFDTRKEMIWDTWVEGGPYTIVEQGGFDPGRVVTNPVQFGQPGFM